MLSDFDSWNMSCNTISTTVGIHSINKIYFLHSANNLCFGAPRPAAKSAITPGWTFRRTDGPTSLLIKRRFSQISIIFESVAGGKTLPRPHNTYFSSKKGSLARRSSITLPLNGTRGYGVSMNTTPWRDAVGWCRRNGCWLDAAASTYLPSLVWESTTP